MDMAQEENNKIINPIEEVEESTTTSSRIGSATTSVPDEEIKNFVDWAIKQNPLVYKRLAEI
jgi:hypothetical protein